MSNLNSSLLYTGRSISAVRPIPNIVYPISGVIFTPKSSTALPAASLIVNAASDSTPQVMPVVPISFAETDVAANSAAAVIAAIFHYFSFLILSL